MVKKVRIVISNGKVAADYIGFTGGSCQELAERLRLEGTAVDQVVAKPELTESVFNAAVQAPDETNRQ